MNNRYSLIGSLVLLASVIVWAGPPKYDPPASAARKPIDLVICLDTSGSMTALIDSARSRIWDIVNELATVKPTPRFRVGLFTYGTPHLSTAAAGWVVRQTDLTDDLDTVYSKMMAMSTSGGDEFVGWVLNDAVKTMSWSTDPGALKLIFVCGNESADQAAERFNFRSVAEQARAQGIVINAIFAGDRAQGLNEKWEEVARHGGGSFHAIDMQEGTYQIETPQDKILIDLNVELNATYIPYGQRGAAGAANQQAQDKNAARVGRQSSSSRVAAKATALYSNAFWDLVDAYASEGLKLEEVPADDLPEKMRSMSVGERKAYVEGMRTSREAIHQKILEANKAREVFIKEERAKKGSIKAGLDDAMLKALREQAVKKGFEFDSR